MLMLYNFIVTEIKILFSIEISSCYYLYQPHNYSQISLRRVCLIKRNKVSNRRQGPTLGVRLVEVSVKRESTVFPIASISLFQAFKYRKSSIKPLGVIYFKLILGGGVNRDGGAYFRKYDGISVLHKELDTKWKSSSTRRLEVL